MKLSFLILGVVFSSGVATAVNVEQEPLSVELMTRFKKWEDYHGKQYDSHNEKMKRLQIWVDNDERINEYNSKDLPFKLGHNAFSDMTEEEFAAHYKMSASDAETSKKAQEAKWSAEDAAFVQDQERALTDNLELPDYVNWVEMGAVAEVKNQGACGACWAFSTTGALEGARFIKTGELVSLSEQNLLDCDHTDLGCGGGLMDNAFKFDEKSGGLCSEEDYPYLARQQKKCNTNCTDVPGSIVKTFIDVPPAKEHALLSAIAMQPISVAIQGSQFVFQFYKTGVLTDSSCGRSGAVDHGVLAVGYGTDLDTQEPYFLVKNSWGPTWGDKGYVKIGRKTKNKYGICSILKMASFPVVE
jgi:C1A family cysteine protease